MKNKTVLNKEEIANEYVKSQIGVEKLASKYHVGKLKIKEILKEFNIRQLYTFRPHDLFAVNIPF